MSSRFSCVALGIEGYSLDLPRAVKNGESALKVGSMVYLDCGCVEFVYIYNTYMYIYTIIQSCNISVLNIFPYNWVLNHRKVLCANKKSNIPGADGLERLAASIRKAVRRD